MKEFDVVLIHINDYKLMQSRKAANFIVAMKAVLNKATCTVGVDKYKRIEIKAVKNRTETTNILKGAF